MLLKLIIPSCLLIVFIIGCKLDDPEAPSADFSTDVNDCTSPCKVTFTNQSANTSVYDWKYSWQIQDSSDAFSLEKNAVFEFNYAGTYQVSLTISNPAYGSDTAVQTIRITAPIAEPIPHFSFELKDKVKKDVIVAEFKNLSANASKYRWDFGDKQVSEEESPKHDYPRLKKDSTYTVMLTAFNVAGSKDSTTHTIKIAKKL